MLNKICVVGAGHWGINHIKTLYSLDALGGVVEKDKRALEKIMNLYPGIKGFGSIIHALQEKEFNGFTVATPAETHFKIARSIIETGKHVLVEKPLTLTLEDAVQLKKLAELHNVNLMVGHVLLFHPAMQKIKTLINEGKIGKLQYLYSNRVNLGKVRTEENVFWSFAPHDISVFQYFTESKPYKIMSTGGDFLQDGIHDTTLTVLEYPGNIKGHIFVSWLHPFKEHRLVVVGSEGMISFEDSKEGKPLKLYSKSFKLNGRIPEKNDGPIEIIDYEQKMPLTEELAYFIDHLDGSQVEIADPRSALEVVEILVKASRSLLEGVPVG